MLATTDFFANDGVPRTRAKSLSDEPDRPRRSPKEATLAPIRARKGSAKAVTLPYTVAIRGVETLFASQKGRFRYSGADLLSGLESKETERGLSALAVRMGAALLPQRQEQRRQGQGEQRGHHPFEHADVALELPE